MQFSMMLSRFGGIVACLFIEVAHAQSSGTRRGGGDVGTNGRNNGDPFIDEATDELMMPCSCDCCQVEERTKSEVVSFANGQHLDYKCVPPAKDIAGPRCPATCKASNADAILTAVMETMDASRYCEYKCKPAVTSVGSVCTRLTEKETAMTTSEDGNGNADGPVFVGADGDAEAPAAAKAAAGPAAPAPAAAAAPPPADDGEDQGVAVRWDMRKLIAQRLRAEAGADMGRAAAAEQRVHSDTYVTIKDKEMTQYVQKVLTPVEGKGQEAQVATMAEAETAREEAAVAQTHLSEAQVDSQSVVAETKKLVKAEIMKQAKAAAKQEAEADAYMWAWDKPDNWGKTLAVKAAAPYLTEMVNAITRTSEYEGFSKGLLTQARGAQAKAQNLVVHANQMKAQGDLIGEATEEKKVALLIGQAKSLEEEANKFWKIADETRKSIPEWQMGGNMAAARAAWEFKIAFTPPPESFLQMHVSEHAF